MRLLLVIILLLLGPILFAESTSDSPEWRYSQAGELYQSEQYDSAAAMYQSLIEDGTEAFELYYNAGNAYYKAGKIGPAILHFEKARKIDPRNADVQYNLELAYLRQPDREPDTIPLNVFAKVWRSVTGVMSSSEWAMIAILCWWLALLGIALYWFSANIGIQKIGFYTFGVTFFLGLLLLVLSFGKRGIEKRDHFAVIMSPSAVIKSAPSHDATDLYILREGFKLRVTDQAGNWTKVMLTDGNTGWMEEEDLADI